MIFKSAKGGDVWIPEVHRFKNTLQIVLQWLLVKRHKEHNLETLAWNIKVAIIKLRSDLFKISEGIFVVIF